MSKKLVITVSSVVVLCICIFIYNLFNSDSLQIDKNDVKQIQLPSTIGTFNISDKKEISDIIDYFNSLNLKEKETIKTVNNNDNYYIGSSYYMKIIFKDNTNKLISIEGDRCSVGEDGKIYEIGILGAKADIVFGDIMQKEEIKNGETSIEGSVISIKSGKDGVNESCIIKANNNVKYNIDLSKTTLKDATGKESYSVSKDDSIRVFYKKNAKGDAKTITASIIYINKHA